MNTLFNLESLPNDGVGAGNFQKNFGENQQEKNSKVFNRDEKNLVKRFSHEVRKEWNRKKAYPTKILANLIESNAACREEGLDDASPDEIIDAISKIPSGHSLIKQLLGKKAYQKLDHFTKSFLKQEGSKLDFNLLVDSLASNIKKYGSGAFYHSSADSQSADIFEVRAMAGSNDRYVFSWYNAGQGELSGQVGERRCNSVSKLLFLSWEQVILLVGAALQLSRCEETRSVSDAGQSAQKRNEFLKRLNAAGADAKDEVNRFFEEKSKDLVQCENLDWDAEEKELTFQLNWRNLGEEEWKFKVEEGSITLQSNSEKNKPDFPFCFEDSSGSRYRVTKEGIYQYTRENSCYIFSNGKWEPMKYNPILAGTDNLLDLSRVPSLRTDEWAQLLRNELLIDDKKVFEQRNIAATDRSKEGLFALSQRHKQGGSFKQSLDLALYGAILSSDGNDCYQDFNELSEDQRLERREELKLALFALRFSPFLDELSTYICIDGFELEMGDGRLRAKEDSLRSLMKKFLTDSDWQKFSRVAKSEENEDEKVLFEQQSINPDGQIRQNVENYLKLLEEKYGIVIDEEGRSACKLSLGCYIYLKKSPDGTISDPIDFLFNLFSWKKFPEVLAGSFSQLNEVLYWQKMTNDLLNFYGKNLKRLAFRGLDEDVRDGCQKRMQKMAETLQEIADVLNKERTEIECQLAEEGGENLPIGEQNDVPVADDSLFIEEKTQKKMSEDEVSLSDDESVKSDDKKYTDRQIWSAAEKSRKNLQLWLSEVIQKPQSEEALSNLNLIMTELGNWGRKVVDDDNGFDAFAVGDDFFNFLIRFCNEMPIDIREPLDVTSDWERVNKLLLACEGLALVLYKANEKSSRAYREDVNYANTCYLLQLHTVQIFNRLVTIRQKNLIEVGGVNREIDPELIGMEPHLILKDVFIPTGESQERYLELNAFNNEVCKVPLFEKFNKISSQDMKFDENQETESFTPLVITSMKKRIAEDFSLFSIKPTTASKKELKNFLPQMEDSFLRNHREICEVLKKIENLKIRKITEVMKENKFVEVLENCFNVLKKNKWEKEKPDNRLLGRESLQEIIKELKKIEKNIPPAESESESELMKQLEMLCKRQRYLGHLFDSLYAFLPTENLDNRSQNTHVPEFFFRLCTLFRNGKSDQKKRPYAWDDYILKIKNENCTSLRKISNQIEDVRCFHYYCNDDGPFRSYYFDEYWENSYPVKYDEAKLEWGKYIHKPEIFSNLKETKGILEVLGKIDDTDSQLNKLLFSEKESLLPDDDLLNLSGVLSLDGINEESLEKIKNLDIFQQDEWKNFPNVFSQAVNSVVKYAIEIIPVWVGYSKDDFGEKYVENKNLSEFRLNVDKDGNESAMFDLMGCGDIGNVFLTVNVLLDPKVGSKFTPSTNEESYFSQKVMNNVGGHIVPLAQMKPESIYTDVYEYAKMCSSRKFYSFLEQEKYSKGDYLFRGHPSLVQYNSDRFYNGTYLNDYINGDRKLADIDRFGVKEINKFRKLLWTVVRPFVLTIDRLSHAVQTNVNLCKYSGYAGPNPQIRLKQKDIPASMPTLDIERLLTILQQNPSLLWNASDKKEAQKLLLHLRLREKTYENNFVPISDQLPEIERLINFCDSFLRETMGAFIPFDVVPASEDGKVVVSFGTNTSESHTASKITSYGTMLVLMSTIYNQLSESIEINQETNSDDDRQSKLQERIYESMRRMQIMFDEKLLGLPINFTTMGSCSNELKTLFSDQAFALALCHHRFQKKFMSDPYLCAKTIHCQIMLRGMTKIYSWERFNILIDDKLLESFVRQFFCRFRNDFIPQYEHVPTPLEKHTLSVVRRLMTITEAQTKDWKEYSEFRKTCREFFESVEKSEIQDTTPLFFDEDNFSYYDSDDKEKRRLIFDMQTTETGLSGFKFDVCRLNQILKDKKELMLLCDLFKVDQEAKVTAVSSDPDQIVIQLQSGPQTGQSFTLKFNGKNFIGVTDVDGYEYLFAGKPDLSTDRLFEEFLMANYLCWAKFERKNENVELVSMRLYSPDKVTELRYSYERDAKDNSGHKPLLLHNAGNYSPMDSDAQTVTTVHQAKDLPLLYEAFGPILAEKMIYLEHRQEGGGKVILEFPEILINDRCLRLVKEGQRLISAENISQCVYSYRDCVAALESLQSKGTVIRLPFSKENPCLILGPNYDPKRPVPAALTSSFTLIYPFSRMKSRGKKNLPYGSYGETFLCEPINYRSEKLTQWEKRPIETPREKEEKARDERRGGNEWRGFSIKWIPSKNGRLDAWVLGSTDPVKSLLQVEEMMERFVAQKDYNNALAWLQYLPKVTPFSVANQTDGEMARNKVFAFLMSDVDPVLEVKIFKLRLFLYWVSVDLRARDKIRSEMQTRICQLYEEVAAGQNHIGEAFQLPVDEEKQLIELVREFTRDQKRAREKDDALANIVEGIALNSSVEEVLPTNEKTREREELMNCRAKYLNRLSKSQKEPRTDSTIKISGQLSGETTISDQEKAIFRELNQVYAEYNVRPGAKAIQLNPLRKLSDAAKVREAVANLKKDESPTVVRVAEDFEEDLEKGDKKIRSEHNYLPASQAEMMNSDEPRKIKDKCGDYQRRMEALFERLMAAMTTNLKALSVPPENRQNVSDWCAKFLLQTRNLRIRQENNYCVVQLANGAELTFKSVGELEQVKNGCRTLLLVQSIINKNRSVLASAEKLIELQGVYREMRKATGAGKLTRDEELQLKLKKREVESHWKILNKEIESQQNMVTTDDSGNYIYYGSILTKIGSGITRDELLAFEAISGFRPRQNQADLLAKLFEGDIRAFQLIMGSGKTAMILPMMAFNVSCRQSGPSVPVILSHASQLESLRGSICHEYKERFGQEVYIVGDSRNDLKDEKFLQEFLSKIREAKANRGLIVMRANDLSKIQLSLFDRLFDRAALLSKARENLNQSQADVDVLEEDELDLLNEILNPGSNFGKKISQENQLEAREKYARIIEEYNHDPVFKDLCEILEFFRKDAVGLIDEADTVLNVKEEVNYPQGREEEPYQTMIDAAMDLTKLIAGVGFGNAALFRLHTNMQDTLTDEEFEKDVEILVDRLWSTSWPDDDGGMSHVFGAWLEEQGFTKDQFLQAVLPGSSEESVRLVKFMTQVKNFLPFDSTDDETIEQRRPYEYLAVVFRKIHNELPKTLKKTNNRDFGLTQREMIDSRTGEAFSKLELAPYVGAGMPSVNSIADNDTKLTYLMQLSICADPHMLLTKSNGSDRLLKMFLDANREMIRCEEQALSSLIEDEQNEQDDWPVQKRFRSVFGPKWDYKAIKKLLHARENLDNGEAIYEEALTEMRAHLATNPAGRIELFRAAAPILMKTYNKRITATSIDLCNCFSQLIACTGTPDNASTWPETIKDEHLLKDPGTESSILIKIMKDIKDGITKVVTTPNNNIATLLRQALTKKGGGIDEVLRDNLRFVLDIGGSFKTKPMDRVAEETIRQLWGMDRAVPISAIVYFKKYENRDGGEFCLMKPSMEGANGQRPDNYETCKLIEIPLTSLQQDVIRSAGADPDRTIYLLDETHTTGTDVKSTPVAMAIAIIDPNSTTMRDMTQGVMRLRQLMDGQSVTIVEVEPDSEPGTTIPMEQVIQNALLCSADAAKVQNMKAAMDKISGALKNIYMRYITSRCADTPSTAYMIADAFRPFFVKESELDPLNLMVCGAVDGAQFIYDYYVSRTKQFVTCLNRLRLMDEPGDSRLATAAIELDRLLQVSRTKNGELNRVLEENMRLLQGETFLSPQEDEDASLENDQEVEQEQEQEQEVEQEQEQETLVEQEQEVEVEVVIEQMNDWNVDYDKIQPRRNYDIYDINPTTISNPQFSVVLLKAISAKEDAGKIQVKGKLRNDLYRTYGDIFPDYLHISTNQRFPTIPHCEIPINPYMSQPKHFLMSPRKDGEYEIVVLSEQEVIDGKKAIEEKLKNEDSEKKNLDSLSVAIFAMDGSLVAGKPGFVPSEKIDNARNWINFYYGNHETLFGGASFDGWLSKNFSDNKPLKDGQIEKSLIAIRWLSFWAVEKSKKSNVVDESLSEEACGKIWKGFARCLKRNAMKTILISNLEHLGGLPRSAGGKGMWKCNVQHLIHSSNKDLQKYSQSIPDELLLQDVLFQNSAAKDRPFWERISDRTFAILLADHPGVKRKLDRYLSVSRGYSEQKCAIFNLLSTEGNKEFFDVRRLDRESLQSLTDVWKSFSHFVQSGKDFSDMRNVSIDDAYKNFYESYYRAFEELCGQLIKDQLLGLHLKTQTAGLDPMVINRAVHEVLEGVRLNHPNDYYELSGVIIDEVANKIKENLENHGLILDRDKLFWENFQKILAMETEPPEAVDVVAFQKIYNEYSELMSKKRTVKAVFAWVFAIVLVFPLVFVGLYRAFARPESWAHSIFGHPITKNGQVLWLQKEISRKFCDQRRDEERKLDQQILKSLIEMAACEESIQQSLISPAA